MYTQEERVLSRVWERFRGHIVMVMNDSVYTAKRGDRAARVVKDLERQYHKRPLITYIPKEGALILFL